MFTWLNSNRPHHCTANKTVPVFTGLFAKAIHSKVTEINVIHPKATLVKEKKSTALLASTPHLQYAYPVQTNGLQSIKSLEKWLVSALQTNKNGNMNTPLLCKERRFSAARNPVR